MMNSLVKLIKKKLILYNIKLGNKQIEVALMSLIGSSIFYILIRLISKFKQYKMYKSATLDDIKLIKIENKGFVDLIKFKSNELVVKNINKNKKIKYSYPSGLINNKNNCYINSLVQCLSSLLYFINYSKYEFSPIIKQLLKAMTLVNNSKESSLQLDLFMNIIKDKFRFADDQQDCYELYNRILEEYNINIDSLNPFMLTTESSYTCLICKTTIYKNETHYNLSVDCTISNSTIKSIQSEISLFDKPIIIQDYICTNCSITSITNQLDAKKDYLLINYINKNIDVKNEDLDIILQNIIEFTENNKISKTINNIRFKPIKSTLEKKNKIIYTNNNLVIHVAYVNYEGKSYNRVLFSDTLDIPNYENNIHNFKKYKLKAFIVHIGSSGMGHYYTYRRFGNLWIRCNDNNINFVNNTEVYECNNPYMLFYELE